MALVVTSCIADWFRHSSMCLLKIRLSAATLRQHTGQVAVEPCTNREEPLGKLVTVLHPGWVNDVIITHLCYNNHHQSNCKCLHPNLHDWYSLNVVVGCHLPSFCEVWSHYILVRLKNFASITCGTTSLLLVSSSKLEAATSW